MGQSPVKNVEINSYFCVFVMLLSQFSVVLSMGLTLSSLNSAAPAIRAFINETYSFRYNQSISQELSTLLFTIAQTSLVCGAVIGAMLVHIVLSKFSRKGTLAFTHTLNIISVLMMAPAARFIPSYEFLIIGRLLSGISRGIAFSAVSVIVSETTCRRRIGVHQVPFTYEGYFAIMLGNLLGHYEILGTSTLWPLLISLTGISSLVYLIAWYWLPQTPAYHIRCGRPLEAMNTLRKLRVGSEEEINLEMERIKEEINAELNIHSASIFTMLKEPMYRKQFFAAMTVFICPQLIGEQVIFFYSDTLFEYAGLPRQYLSYASAGMCVPTFFAAFIAFPLFRIIGFKKLYIAGLTGVVFSLIVFTAATATYQTVPVMSYVSVGALAFYLFSLCIGPHFGFIGLTSELTTQTTRPTVIFYGVIIYSSVGTATSFIFPYSAAAWGAYSYIPFIVLGVLVNIIIMIFVPNTHKKSISQIQRRFSKTPRQSKVKLEAVSNPGFVVESLSKCI